MDIAELRHHGATFQTMLDERKQSLADRQIPWYPYGTLGNLQWLELLLAGAGTTLPELLGSGPIADIGAADGDLAFLLDSLGYDVDIVDYPPTNYNGCRAAHALKRSARARRSTKRISTGASSCRARAIRSRSSWASSTTSGTRSARWKRSRSTRGTPS
jgi:hypothetical protein